MKLTAETNAPGDEVRERGVPTGFHRRLAERLTECLLLRPMWSANESAMFHADPHAGNLMIAGDGLAILDWALVGRLSSWEREQLVQLVLRATLLDGSGICGAIEGLCVDRGCRTDRLLAIVERGLAELREMLIPTVSWLTRLLDSAATDARARFSGDLLLFRKAVLMIDGVVSDLVGERFLDEFLTRSVIGQLTREWPTRAFMPPNSRAIGSRLSNLDLVTAGYALPFSMGSRWLAGVARSTESAMREN